MFLYQLKEGICQSSYAANIATLAGLAPALVQRGVEVKTHRQSHSCIGGIQKLNVCVFGQVSELYRTGKPIKRIDTVSTDKQANRLVKLISEKMAVKAETLFQ